MWKNFLDFEKKREQIGSVGTGEHNFKEEKKEQGGKISFPSFRMKLFCTHFNQYFAKEWKERGKDPLSPWCLSRVVFSSILARYANTSRRRFFATILLKNVNFACRPRKASFQQMKAEKGKKKTIIFLNALKSEALSRMFFFPLLMIPCAQKKKYPVLPALSSYFVIMSFLSACLLRSQQGHYSSGCKEKYQEQQQ